MDVNETLGRLREAVRDYHRADTYEDEAEAGGRVADAFISLDGWLSKGGFLPADWADNRPIRYALVGE